jgi:hypothetical protein
MNDFVNKPDHYHSGGIDVIRFGELQFNSMELQGFYRMNVLKYVTRFHKKGKALEDLEKAEFYLKKLIDLYKSFEELS